MLLRQWPSFIYSLYKTLYTWFCVGCCPALYSIISQCSKSQPSTPPPTHTHILAELRMGGDQCLGRGRISLDYVTSSGRPLKLFPPLLREGEKKRPFHYWDCHSQFRLTVSMHKASWIPPTSPALTHTSNCPQTHTPTDTHQTPPHPPLPLQQVAVVTVWLDHQSWPLTTVFLSTWTGRSQLALSYRCPPDPALCMCVCL